jgi:DNA polymerase delta subunit 1
MASSSRTVTLFPVDWSHSDIEYLDDSRAEIHAWGKTIDGRSALLRIAFTPYFFVKAPGWSDARQRLFITECVQKYKAMHTSSMPVKRVPLLGFTNNSQMQFVQLAFPTFDAFRKARYGLARERHHTFEAALDPLLRFFHLRDIQPAQWIHADGITPIAPDDPGRVAASHVCEYVTSFQDVSPAPDVTDIPPLVIASWDLETMSGSGMFPDSSRLEDQIITIGTAFQRYGEDEPYLRSAIALDTCDSIQGVDVVPCATEADVVNEWLQLLRDQHVDIMIGYNTLGFDYKYLDGRHSILVDDMGEPEIEMHLLGKAARGGGEPVEKRLSSAAYGDNKYFYLKSPGVMCLDLLQIFRKELKLDSYSLGNVSKKYLDDGETKIDLKPWEIFKKFTQGSAERAEIATYCVRDVELPLKLMRRLSTLENTMQMANAVCCPIDFLQNRGQQIRVYSQLVRKARSLGFVCPDTERSDHEGPPEKYEGATVLNAERGAYFDIISALDFASLYPSIIRAHTMCPSTLVLDPAYATVDGIEYYEIETGAGVARFAQDVKCVVPALLEELAAFRKQAKKDMAAAKDRGDAFAASVFNAKQNAYKVSMNSVYGFFGAVRGMLPVVQLAAAVTATGRAMIEHSKALAEKLVPGTRVIYGDTDSIMCKFKVDDDKRYDMHEHFRVAQWVADEITKTFTHPIELEFEKTYYPYMLFSKKRYAGLMFTKPDAPDYIDVKGLQLVRRDNAPIVKDVSNAILDILMHERDPNKAVSAARDTVLNVLQHNEPLDKFVISKALRSGYKNPQSLPHVAVAEKLKQRRGYPPASGERVPYVFVRDAANPDGLQAQRAEDPEYVKEHPEVEVDTLYYITNQILSPITTLLEVVLGGPENVHKEIMGHPDVAPLVDALQTQKSADIKVAKRVRTNTTNKQFEITSFFKPRST